MTESVEKDAAYPECTCGPSAPYDSHEWDCPRNPQNIAQPMSDPAHTTLDYLEGLSSRSSDGRLRDAIALVRSAVWDDLETRVTPPERTTP